MDIHINGVAEKDKWPLARAILEHVQEGASRHCLEQHKDAVGDVIMIAHHRHGVTISFGRA